MPEYVTIWETWDSVIFAAGLALGAAGRQGVHFFMHTLKTIRGQEHDHRSSADRDPQADREESK